MYIPTKTTSLVGGSILIVSFAFYIASVGWAISRGALTAPEDSEEGGSSDSDDSSDGGSSTNDIVVEGRHEAEGDNHNFIAPPRLERNGQTTPLLNPGSSVMHSLPGPSRRKQRHTLAYHIFYLILGFLAICIAGYVLSHAATTIIDELNIPDVLFGVVVLAIATTLPEKFIAVMSGHRGHTGVLVANTAGSNIFLLTLCNGIILLNTKGSFEHGSVGIVELGVLWASTIAFAGTIWFGARFFQWIGYAMIATYITFIVLESTIL
jgi:Ca2+/H+ antiporter